MNEITKLLKDWNNGDAQALDRLMPLVEGELRKIAHGYMRREQPGNILQTTDLINETFLKLIRENTTVQNRKHFYARVASRMRQVLADYAKKAKKGGDVSAIDQEPEDRKSREHILIERALSEFESVYSRQAKVVECRHFIGLTIPETAKILDISPKTVERDWDFARSWLKRAVTKN